MILWIIYRWKILLGEVSSYAKPWLNWLNWCKIKENPIIITINIQCKMIQDDVMVILPSLLDWQCFSLIRQQLNTLRSGLTLLVLFHYILLWQPDCVKSSTPVTFNYTKVLFAGVIKDSHSRACVVVGPFGFWSLCKTQFSWFKKLLIFGALLAIIRFSTLSQSICMTK